MIWEGQISDRLELLQTRTAKRKERTFLNFTNFLMMSLLYLDANPRL